jgi:hypothetical protein
MRHLALLLLTGMSCRAGAPKRTETLAMGAVADVQWGGQLVKMGDFHVDAMAACPDGGLVAAGHTWDDKVAVSQWHPTDGLRTTTLGDYENTGGVACLSDGSVVLAQRMARDGRHAVRHWWPEQGTHTERWIQLGRYGSVTQVEALEDGGYALAGEVDPEAVAADLPKRSGVFVAVYENNDDGRFVQTFRRQLAREPENKPRGNSVGMLWEEDGQLHAWVDQSYFRQVEWSVPSKGGAVKEVYRVSPDPGKGPGLHSTKFEVKDLSGPPSHRLLVGSSDASYGVIAEVRNGQVLHQIEAVSGRDGTFPYGILQEAGGLLLYGSHIQEQVFDKPGVEGHHWLADYNTGELVSVKGTAFVIASALKLSDGSTALVGKVWSGDEPLTISGTSVHAPPEFDGQPVSVGVVWINPLGA